MQIPSGLTQEQSDQISEILLQKAQLEKEAAAEKAKFELECMSRESEARIAAVTAAASAGTAVARRPMDGEDDSTCEVHPESKSIRRRFARLPQEQIIKIFHNKFDPIDLYRLRYRRGLQAEADQDQDYFFVQDGLLKVRRAGGSYKNFGESFHEVWGEAFLNYITIFVSFVGREASDLCAALIQFHGRILELSRIYEWQGAVLPLAIEVHSYFIHQNPLDPVTWSIPVDFQSTFCPSDKAIGWGTLVAANKRKRSRSPPSHRIGRSFTRYNDTNNASVTCERFNKGCCKWDQCRRAHECKGCGAEDHGLASCRSEETEA